jgi:hypothetical protein
MDAILDFIQGPNIALLPVTVALAVIYIAGTCALAARHAGWLTRFGPLVVSLLLGAMTFPSERFERIEPLRSVFWLHAVTAWNLTILDAFMVVLVTITWGIDKVRADRRADAVKALRLERAGRDDEARRRRAAQIRARRAFCARPGKGHPRYSSLTRIAARTGGRKSTISQ